MNKVNIKCREVIGDLIFMTARREKLDHECTTHKNKIACKNLDSILGVISGLQDDFLKEC